MAGNVFKVNDQVTQTFGAGPAKTVAERQEALRKRRLEEGPT